MIKDYKTVRVRIHTKRADSKKANWDEEWEMWWDDDLTLKLDKEIEREANFPHKGKPVQIDPREFAALLRALADEIEFLTELKDEAQAEFVEREGLIRYRAEDVERYIREGARGVKKRESAK